jgi:hypothetical protein
MVGNAAYSWLRWRRGRDADLGSATEVHTGLWKRETEIFTWFWGQQRATVIETRNSNETRVFLLH